jgi:drug/metabolite transporter (DMT)-like permease
MKQNCHPALMIAAFAIIYIVWGTTYLAMRIAVETIPPFLMAGTRFLVAGAATYAILKLRSAATPTFNQVKQGTIVALFLLVGGNGLVCWAEQEIPSGIAALVVATMPMWMCIFDWLLFKAARPRLLTTIGLCMGFAGIGLLFGPSIGSNDAHALDVFSLCVLTFAPVFWSLGSLYSRNADLPKNIFMSIAIQFISGGLMMFVISLILGEWQGFNVSQVSLESFVALLYLAVFGSVIALTAYVWLMKQTSSTRVSTYTYVNPIIAVFLGWLILDETIGATTQLAILIIVSSVVLVVAFSGASRPRDIQKHSIAESVKRDAGLNAEAIFQPVVPDASSNTVSETATEMLQDQPMYNGQTKC